MNTQRRRRCASDCLNAVSILCKEIQNLFRGLSGRARRDLRPFQKERQPFLPRAVCSYTLKQVVVPIAIRFEVQAEVQERLSQRALGAKQERYEQPPESAVAVQKRVDCLKLHVDQAGFDQDRQLVFLVVEKTLQIIQTLHQSLWRRRNKRSIAGTSSADPVLRPAEFARCSVGPAPPAQQDGVNFAYESEREREAARDPTKPMLHRGDVVRNFFDIVN